MTVMWTPVKDQLRVRISDEHFIAVFSNSIFFAFIN